MGILWQGLTHDLSKFSPAEWGPYVAWFHGPWGIKLAKTTSADWTNYNATKLAFDRAWLHHQHNNPHHWEYWLQPGGPGAPVKLIPIPRRYLREMAADWKAMSWARGLWGDCTEWYASNKECISMHPDSREIIEVLIGWRQI